MSWAELLAGAESIRDGAAAGEPQLKELRIVGVGWATVEADRAFAELGTALEGAGAWVPGPRDVLLGASAWRREPAPDRGVEPAPGGRDAAPGLRGPDLVVLEPDTEGRLAAFLARFGEGVGAVYLTSPGNAGDRLVSLHPRWGPYVIVRGGAP